MTKDHKAFGVHPSIPFRMFSKGELSKLLGCTVRTIDRMIAAGRIPYVELPSSKKKGGRKIKFDSRDIEKWIQEHRRASRDEEERERQS